MACHVLYKCICRLHLQTLVFTVYGHGRGSEGMITENSSPPRDLRLYTLASGNPVYAVRFTYTRLNVPVSLVSVSNVVVQVPAMVRSSEGGGAIAVPPHGREVLRISGWRCGEKSGVELSCFLSSLPSVILRIPDISRAPQGVGSLPIATSPDRRRDAGCISGSTHSAGTPISHY